MTTGFTNNSTKVEPLSVEQELKAISLAVPTREELQLLLSCVDLTSLEGKDTDQGIVELAEKARIHEVAAVCVYPTLVKTAKIALTGSAIRVASVAGAFPSGQLPLELRLEEVRYALQEGADEIDMVISRREFLQKNYAFTVKEVRAIKDVCGNKTLKVILETGELQTLDNIALASRLAIEGGADFIKTSTGKIGENATLPAVYAMLLEIKNHFKNTGKKVGVKPSGGIADGDTAVKYSRLTEQLLGKEWITPSLFRIGASRLVNNLVAEMQGKNSQTNTHYGY
ncbi:MAG TPA: deoxyribose-phosphate aldolase [Bacteroidia bacterium]|jgi:deoxyribose-phosphate aldolase|nr:deoxyribose-phosphate aldolase [Bacteroidia bacterium]